MIFGLQSTIMHSGYCRPHSVEEALEFKSRYDPGAVFLGGGTDLMLRLPRPCNAVLIDLGAAGLDGVVLSGGVLHARSR